MTRTAVHHTLSAAVALVLASAFAATASSAGELQNTERELVDSMQTMHRAFDKPTFGGKFKMGSTRRGAQAITSIVSGFNSVNR